MSYCSNSKTWCFRFTCHARQAHVRDCDWAWGHMPSQATWRSSTKLPAWTPMTMPTVLDSILLRSLSRCSCFDTESLNLWDSGVDVDHGVLLKSQTDANHSKTGNQVTYFLHALFQLSFLTCLRWIRPAVWGRKCSMLDGWSSQKDPGWTLTIPSRCLAAVGRVNSLDFWTRIVPYRLATSRHDMMRVQALIWRPTPYQHDWCFEWMQAPKWLNLLCGSHHRRIWPTTSCDLWLLGCWKRLLHQPGWKLSLWCSCSRFKSRLCAGWLEAGPPWNYAGLVPP